jgi:hypothetical protein
MAAPTRNSSHSGTEGAPSCPIPGTPAGEVCAGASDRWPVAVAGRLAALFVVLGGIKVLLLAGLGKYLCDTHWRVETGAELGWVDGVVFGLFLVLGVGSLLVLARDCRRVGIGAVRAANATVLGLGLLFIFLTFHTGPRNYLYPIMTQVLKWDSLRPYLSLDLCFRPPYLALWLGGYAVAYYALARSGREGWTLHLTAVCAGAYGLICRRDLLAYREIVVVADCLGVVSVLIALRPRGGFGAGWMLAPAAWTFGFAWSVYYFVAPKEIEPRAYLNLVIGGSLVLFGGATWLAARRGYAVAWNRLAPFWFFSFLLLTNVYYPLAANFSHLLCLGLEAPHYFAGELALVGALGLVAILYRRLFRGRGLGWVDVAAVGLIVAAVVDLGLERVMGQRLDWDGVALAMGEGPRMVWRMIRPHLVGGASGLGLLVALYLAASRGFERWFRGGARAGSAGRPRAGVVYAAAAFGLLALVGALQVAPDKAQGQAALRLVQSSPLWQGTLSRAMNREELLQTAAALGLGALREPPAGQTAGPPRDLNVLLVLLESSYNSHLSLFSGTQETQPLLRQYRERMELFPNFFSSFQGSIHAQFAAFTSLYPTRDYRRFTLQRVNVKSLFEVLHEHGYSCSLFYSTLFGYTGFGEFLRQRGIDEMYDADSMPGARAVGRVDWGLREGETLGAIRARIKKYGAEGQRFFLTYIPVAPHYPYDGVPEAFKRFKPGPVGDHTAQYLNELLYLDWVIASILDQLKESGLLDKTLVVITDDHGEMLGANGGPIGHGWRLTPELANIPLILMDPEKPGARVNYAVGSQVDLLPTLLDRLRIPPPSDQLYQGRSLDAAADPRRIEYLNSYQQYGIIRSNRYICLADRQAPGSQRGLASAVAVISNQGPRTVFTQEPGGCPLPAAIDRFDAFQENLLHNYSRYCRLLHPDAEPKVVGVP